MNLIKSMLTKNSCYTANRKIKVKGLMLHSVGCPQPKASVFVTNWNRPNVNKCVHAFIDANDGVVYQTLPWNHRGWHCGGSGNDTHVGVEMCEPACIKYTGGSNFTCSNMAEAKACAKRTYESAVALFAMLCKENGLDPLAKGVILSHREGCASGIASNHGDPEHLWNQLNMGYTMDTFRKAVAAAMGKEAPKVDNSTKVPFVVSIKIKDLNIRKGPGTNYAKLAKPIAPGAYTIVEVKEGKGSDSGWGRLKSDAGWISLDYANYNKATSVSSKKSVTAIAKEVIAGKWGNGAARKAALTEAGYDYAAVQKKVNELI